MFFCSISKKKKKKEKKKKYPAIQRSDSNYIHAVCKCWEKRGLAIVGTRVTINSLVFARLPREIIGCYMIVTPRGTSLVRQNIHRCLYTYTVVDLPRGRSWKPIPTFSILVNGSLIYAVSLALFQPARSPDKRLCRDISHYKREKRRKDHGGGRSLNWNVAQRMLTRVALPLNRYL